MKENCWEYMGCGKHPGGGREAEKGVCAAHTEGRLNGVHGGSNGGRACWMVAGTLCNDCEQGSYASKIFDCRSCEFYKKVKDQQGEDFLSTYALISMLD